MDSSGFELARFPPLFILVQSNYEKLLKKPEKWLWRTGAHLLSCFCHIIANVQHTPTDQLPALYSPTAHFHLVYVQTKLLAPRHLFSPKALQGHGCAAASYRLDRFCVRFQNGV